MSLNLVLGIFVILVAYVLTWYLLLKSANIVKIIDQEGLTFTREIKNRLKHKSVEGKHYEKTRRI